ncbi:MAG: ABC transporter ATP-binding protein [Planctomycetota bacterium]|jgi:iron complex transport system ATP-binding protein
MNAIIDVKNLSFGYHAGQQILKDLSFEVPQGTFLAIAGPNGVGKSTLLNLICATFKPDSGIINIDNKNLESYTTQALAEKVAVVRQEFVPVFGFSAIETVMMARTPYFNQLGFETEADREIVNEALKATDTIQFATRALAELSGGERQRVFIARAIAQNTNILLLDEPTSHLDFKHQVGIYDLLKQIQLEQGKTIIAVTHDINLAAQYAEKILLVGPEYQYSIGEPRQVLSVEQIERTFGVKVFSEQIGEEAFFLPLGNFAKDMKKNSS